jgi:hypothetical protein
LYILYLIAWFGLVMIAILNGALRQTIILKYTSELTAHQLSCLTGFVFFGLVFWLLSRIYPLTSAARAWQIGFTWLAMTVCFEFLFGHYVMKHSWEKLLHDYNIFAGRFWMIILIWTTIGPYIFYKLN